MLVSLSLYTTSGVVIHVFVSICLYRMFLFKIFIQIFYLANGNRLPLVYHIAGEISGR